jgi:hypothetical protein
MILTKSGIRKGLSSDNLKVIALLTMTLFHTADILFPWWKQYVPDEQAAALYILCIAIGMLAMPVICFLAAEGIRYTKNLKKYWLRISLWAIPAHIAFTFATGKPHNPFTAPFIMHTSVLWTISCGIGAVYILRCSHIPRMFQIVIITLLMILSVYGDWGVCAAMAIVCMAHTHKDFKKQMLVIALCFGASLIYT